MMIAFWCLVAAAAACSHRQHSASAQHLYAAIAEAGRVLVYPVTASGSTEPLATIKEEPPDKPIDVSVDLIGEVFVVNENGNVRAFGGHDYHYQVIHLVAGPHTGIRHPTALVTDMVGNFYVAEAATTADQARVEWFAGGQNGNVFPNRVLSGPHTGITAPAGLGLDGSGRLFVADRATNRVLVFSPQASGDATPLAVMTGLNRPEHVFVDELLNVYVANKGDNSLSVFITNGPQSWTHNATITSRAMRQPEGVAVDDQGRIAVAVTGGISFFAADSNGRVEPLAELRGVSPMNPAGIFIH